jgi:hypothetical protein
MLTLSIVVDDPESQYQVRNVLELLQLSPLVVDPHDSRPGAFPEGESLYTTQTRTNHTPNPVPVLSTQSRLEEGFTQSEERGYMVEATLVSNQDLVVAHIVEPAEEQFWRQRKVQCCAFLLFLTAVVLAFGLGVGFCDEKSGNLRLYRSRTTFRLYKPYHLEYQYRRDAVICY